MQHKLPQLNYSYDALEPYIDARTMEVHHSKHHQGYTDKTNAILEKYPNLQTSSVEELISDISKLEIEEKDRIALKNNGGGYINHKLFWEILAPVKQVDQALKLNIEAEFGSIKLFKEQFAQVAATQFGSGWAWLVKDENDKLKIYSLPNQDSPLSLGHKPIFNLDVWEHAYYLKYQNRRTEYIDNWWNVLKFL